MNNVTSVVHFLQKRSKRLIKIRTHRYKNLEATYDNHTSDTSRQYNFRIYIPS